jgi:hypothetical protein
MKTSVSIKYIDLQAGDQFQVIGFWENGRVEGKRIRGINQ